jgi:hypothetical protein
MKHLAVAVLFVLTLPYFSSAQRLERFGNNGISYAVIKTLYGIIPTKNIPSAPIKDTINYFVYLWLPDSVSEISMRLISPVPSFVYPNTGEKITEDYQDPPDTSYKKYFDPEVRLEKSLNADAPEDAFQKSNLLWKRLGFNDNSAVLLAQPSGEKNNSLLRVVVNQKKNIRLTTGLYRIRFRAHAEKNPAGTFMLQVGLMEMIPGIKLFRLAEEL